MALSVLPSLGDVSGVAARAVLLTLAFTMGSLIVVPPAVADVVDDALLLAGQGDRAGAIESLHQSLSRLRGDRRAKALFALGTLTVDFEDARARYEEILHRHRGSPFAGRALLQLGEAALAGGELDAAHAYFREAAEVGKHSDDRSLALLRDGQVLLQLSQPGEARARFRLLADEQPDGVLRSRVDALLAVCDFREGLYDDTLDRCLSMIDGESPLKSTALLYAGRSLMAKGEPDLALEYFDRVATEYTLTATAATARVLGDSLRVELGQRVDAHAPDVATAPVVDGSSAPGGAESPAYVVHLGRYRERIRAFALLSDLRRRGIENASLERTESEEGRHFFIRIGPFSAEAGAIAERDRLEGISGVVGVVVLQEDM